MRFDGARAKNQLAVEADVCPGNALTSGFDSAGEVDFGIGEGCAEGQLAAGQDDGLRLTQQHVGQRGGGVAHRIRAVGNDDAVAGLHGAVNGVGKLRPLFRLNVAGIHREHVHRQERHAVAASDALRQFIGMERRRQTVRRLAAGDCSARSQQCNAHSSSPREIFQLDYSTGIAKKQNLCYN